MTPDVSVVIATRDRPACLSRLLTRVKAQTHAGFECLVVDDASSSATLARYDEIWRGLDDRFRLLTAAAPMASGPSAARNRGIRAATGAFVAFCDDDDSWIDDHHLSVAVGAMRANDADLFFANMQTSRNGEIIGPDFYGTIRSIITRKPIAPALYEVEPRSRAAAMQHMFLHCDSLVVSRLLLERAGLFWEKLSMAEDRDLGLRLLDAAETVLYRDAVVADYDRSGQIGLCKAYSEDEIRQFVMMAMLHAETGMCSAAMRRVARGYRAWMLVELAQIQAVAGRPAQARELARQSLFLRPTAAAARILAGFGPRPPATLAAPRRTEAP